MNLLYENIDSNTQHNFEMHTKQIENPNISFDDYISNIKRGMEEESEVPDPDPTLSRGEGNEGGHRDPNPSPDPNPDPNPTTINMGCDECLEGHGEDTIRSTSMNAHNDSDPNKHASSYSIGLSIKHDYESHDREVIMDTIADSGADIDVITGKHKDTYHNITRLANTTLNGIGGPSRVYESADHEHLPGLNTNQGIINDKSDTSCLSISSRARKGWLFWASGGVAQLVTPTKTAFNFILKEGLYRLTNMITEYKGVVFGERDDLLSGEELVADEHHSMMKSVTKSTKKASENSGMSVKTIIMILTLSMLFNAPSLSALPLLKLLLDKKGSNIESIIDVNVPKTKRKYKGCTVYEHNCRCHMPHDKRCEACLRARMMAKSNTSNDDDMVVGGSDKGYVYSMDYVGPYTPDVDGNIYGLVGVETGHTNYGITSLTKNRESSTSLQGFKIHRNKLRQLGHDDKDIVRLHHDCDKSFEGELKQYLIDEHIADTDTGGYNPAANSRVERRNRSIKEAFKAALFFATGGLSYYNALWGPGLKFATCAVNNNDDSSGRNYYKNLTNKEYIYDIGGRDLSFGQQVFYYLDKAQRHDEWGTSGKEAVWVGRSDKITDGHIVVPIEWDPDTKIYKLLPTVHVNKVRYEHIVYPLKMGPIHDGMSDTEREASFDTYVESLFRPWYKVTECDEEYQIDGEDPIWEVESIEGHIGKGHKLKYLVKWKDHEVKTYEPYKHLFKYGAKEAILEYQNKIKMNKKKKANLAHTDATLYYCNITERYVEEYDQVKAVRQLINKQNKEGTVEDWITPYKDEYDQICRRRLTRLNKDELTREIRRTAIPMRMLLETKRDGRRKARLVALGYREPREWDTKSNSSPVADITSIRTMLYKAGNPDDIISSIDVSVAFLQANPYEDDDIKRYVSFKPYDSSETLYYNLRGVLYGQRSGGRLWYDTLAEWLESEGYKRQDNEPCLFINDKGFTVLAYVDDLICRGSEVETDKFYKLLNKRFDCKDEVILTPESTLAFLGFDITCCDYEPQEITGYSSLNTMQVNKQGKVRVIYMDQCEAIDTYLSNNNARPIRNIASPMGDKKQLVNYPTLLEGEEINRFQSNLGTINYFAATTRYDIAYAASRLSQYASKPTVGARMALERIMSYLLATQDFKIKGVYSPKIDILSPYSDSDWAGDMPITTCSHSGTMIILNDVPIRWRSKKQPKTSRSSAEAEIYALSETVGETRHLGWKMQDFGMHISEPYTIYVDNQQCISFTKNITVTSRLRTTYNMKDKWIKELRDDNVIKTEYVNGMNNPADILTKALPAYKHRVIMKSIQCIKTPTIINVNSDPNPNPNQEDDNSDSNPNPNPNPNQEDNNSDSNPNPNPKPKQHNSDFHPNPDPNPGPLVSLEGANMAKGPTSNATSKVEKEASVAKHCSTGVVTCPASGHEIGVGVEIT